MGLPGHKGSTGSFLAVYEGLEELDLLDRRLRRVAEDPYMDELLEVVGELVLTQTKRRVAETKESPDGDPWPPVKVDPGFGSILYRDHDLYDSLLYQRSGSYLAVGSDGNPGAATHNFGRGAIPAREYVGMGRHDLEQVEALTKGWVSELLGGSAR